MDSKYFDIVDDKAQTLEEERAIVHYISTNDLDRTRDVMIPGGMDATDFLKAQTVFFNHNTNLPIAKNDGLEVDSRGVKAKTVFSKTKFADDVYQWHKEGIVKTWSIGFTAKREDVEMDDKTGIWTYNKWTLLEYSSAPLPANPNALDIAKSITKSIEGISMVETAFKHYEVKGLIEANSKELAEIKSLLESFKKTPDVDIEKVKAEIRGEVNERIESLKNIIENHSKTLNESLTGVKREVEQRITRDKDLSKMILDGVVKLIDSKIVGAFLQVTGKEIKL